MIFAESPDEGSQAVVKSSTRRVAPRGVEWLKTGSGPFVLIPTHTVSQWGGVRGEGSPNDFDRACEVADYLGSIPFGDADALVLGDDPFPTAFLRAPTFGGGYIVRMLWGDDMKAAVGAVFRVGAAQWTTEPVCFDAGPGRLTLFDASEAGPRASQRIDVELCPGRHALASADYKVRDMCLLIHRLVPLA